MDRDTISHAIIGAAIEVHKRLGPGLLESAYEECLHYELDRIGLVVIKQKPMPLIYEGRKLDLGYRIDLLVEDKVILEIKSVEALIPVHMAQLMTYLKLSGCRLGLLINFNVALIKNGIDCFPIGEIFSNAIAEHHLTFSSSTCNALIKYSTADSPIFANSFIAAPFTN